MFATTMSMLSTAALYTIGSALPVNDPNIVPRAGGPAMVPLPSTCIVTNPLPDSSATSYQPAPLTSNAVLYSAYYPSFTPNKTAMAEQCLQQCYGYGYHVECKTVFWAENVVVPAGHYGISGGQLSTACILFSRALTMSDFFAAPEGQATDAFAGNIVC